MPRARAWLLLIVTVVALLAAKMIFHVRVAVAGFKYLVVLGILLLVVFWLARRLTDRKD